jgi:transcriptional regulator with XRE-family HTH domain
MAKKSIQDRMPIAVRQAIRELGELIRLGRRERRFTQEELAERTGVSRMTVVRMEKGAPEVAVGHYLTAAWILGLPVLAWSDFAGMRAESSLAPYLENLRKHLSERVRAKKGVLSDDF